MMALAFGIAALAMLVLALVAFARYHRNREDGWVVLLPTVGFLLFELGAYLEMSPHAKKIFSPTTMAFSLLCGAYAYLASRHAARRSASRRN